MRASVVADAPPSTVWGTLLRAAALVETLRFATSGPVCNSEGRYCPDLAIQRVLWPAGTPRTRDGRVSADRTTKTCYWAVHHQLHRAVLPASVAEWTKRHGTRSEVAALLRRAATDNGKVT